MIPASRTPEGTPKHCPLCGKPVCLEPSSFPTYDAPCPHCGQLLTFAQTPVESLVPELAREPVWVLSPTRRQPRTPEHDKAPFDTFDRVAWALAASVSTVFVGANDGLIAASLWFAVIVAFSQLALPWIFRRARSITLAQERFYLGACFGWGLVPGPYVGVLFGVLWPWVYEWEISSFTGGLLGLIVGPCVAVVQGLVTVAILDVIVWFVTGTRLSKS